MITTVAELSWDQWAVLGCTGLALGPLIEHGARRLPQKLFAIGSTNDAPKLTSQISLGFVIVGIFVISIASHGWGPQGVVVSLFGTCVLLLSIIDARTQFLPDVLTLPLLAFGLLACTLKWGVVDWSSSLLGAVVGYAVLTLVATAYRRCGGKDGLGGGDIKLISAIGAHLGWQGLPTVVLMASISGLAYMGLWRAVYRTPKHVEPIAFGPFLGAAAWIFLVW